MAFTDRNEAMQNAWKKTPPAEKFTAPPDGKYQAVIKKATLALGTKGKLKGCKMVNFELSILAGPQKNRKVWRNINLDAKAKDDTGKMIYFGIAQFKADMDTLEIDIPETFSEKGIARCLKDAVDCVVDIQVKQNAQGYTNVYINRLVNSSDTEDENEEETSSEEEDNETEDTESESETESSEEDNSEEDEEEEEEKPVVKKKKKKKPQEVDNAAMQAARKMAESMGVEMEKPKKAKPQEKEEEKEDWQDAFED